MLPSEEDEGEPVSIEEVVAAAEEVPAEEAEAVSAEDKEEE